MSHSIPRHLHTKLMAIAPSKDRQMQYRPCFVVLRDGTRLPRVYVVPAEPYLRYWGVRPEQDPAKRWISVSDIVDLGESPDRLPAHLATFIYEGGESGMGYCQFTVVFRDGTTQPYVTGNAVDFVPLPEGQTTADILSVERHAGRNDPRTLRAAEYYWCIYDGVE